MDSNAFGRPLSCRILVDRNALAAGTRESSEEEYHYLIRVRRLRVGDTFVAFDGEGSESVGTIEKISATSASLSLETPTSAPISTTSKFHVLLPFIKGDRLETSISQLVELGVAHISLYRAERAVVTLDETRAQKRLERFRRIATASAQQSRRSDVPKIDGQFDLEGSITNSRTDSLKLFCWTGATKALFDQVPPKPPEWCTIISGPEGGLSEAEVGFLTEAGFAPVSLGKRVLRAATAPVAVVSAISLYY